jgi:hypothetical protein
MSSPARFDADDDEETSLLDAQCDASHQPTPLPTVQLSVLLLPSIAEAVMFSSMSPYINQVWWYFRSFRHISPNASLACSRASNRGRRCTKSGVLHRNHSASLDHVFLTREMYCRRPLFIMFPRPSLRFTGTVFPITLAASPLCYFASQAQPLQ